MQVTRRSSLLVTRNVALIVLTHLCLFLALCAAYLNSYSTLQHEVKAQETIAQATILSKYFYDAGLAIGAYSLTKNAMFAERYARLAEQIPNELAALHTLIDGASGADEVRFQTIRQIVEKGLSKLAEAKMTADKVEFTVLTDDQGQGRKAYKEVKSLADQLQWQLDQLIVLEKQVADSGGPVRRRVLEICPLVLLFFYTTYNIFSMLYRRRTSE